MISGQKVLVTGASGTVGFPVARELARDNEVWGMARLREAADRKKLVAAGVRPVVGDLAVEPLADLPDDFAYVFHTAVVNPATEPDAERVLEGNVRATGRLLRHCRRARGFVHCSTGSVYQYQGMRPLRETDPPGVHHRALYSMSKLASEELVRWISVEHGVPCTIIRIFSAYGPGGGAPAWRLDGIVRGEPVRLHPDRPNHYNPMYEDDVARLGIAALLAARTPPLVVNFGGSEAVSAEEYCSYLGELVAIEPRFEYTTEAYTPLWADVTRMHAELGKTQLPWREGMRRLAAARYPKHYRD